MKSLRPSPIIRHELVVGSTVMVMASYVIWHDLYYRNELWNLPLRGQ